MVAVMVQNLWLGGQRLVGDTDSVRTGGVVSSTVTVWVSVSRLPASSSAVHVTVVAPMGKIGGASLPTATDGSQTSPTVGVPSVTATPPGEAHSALTSGGA